MEANNNIYLLNGHFWMHYSIDYSVRRIRIFWACPTTTLPTFACCICLAYRLFRLKCHGLSDWPDTPRPRIPELEFIARIPKLFPEKCRCYSEINTNSQKHNIQIDNKLLYATSRQFIQCQCILNAIYNWHTNNILHNGKINCKNTRINVSYQFQIYKIIVTEQNIVDSIAALCQLYSLQYRFLSIPRV